MSEPGKITASHRSRAAVIYVRQSTLVQVERNTESTARQYDLVSRARELGWPREAIRVIDGDLGISGSVTGQRDGFEGMVAEVALGQVGIIVAGGLPAGSRQRGLVPAAGPGRGVRHAGRRPPTASTIRRCSTTGSSWGYLPPDHGRLQRHDRGRRARTSLVDDFLSAPRRQRQQRQRRRPAPPSLAGHLRRRACPG